jgi:hypothetical protein
VNRRCQPSISASASANAHARAVSQVTGSTEDEEASAPNVVPATRQRRRRPPPNVCPSRGEHCAAQIAVLRPRSVDVLLCEKVAVSSRLYLTVHVIVRQVGAGRAVAPVAARSPFRGVPNLAYGRRNDVKCEASPCRNAVEQVTRWSRHRFMATATALATDQATALCTLRCG